MQAYLLTQYLGNTNFVSPDWAFGQAVAFTVWIPCDVEYIYLKIGKFPGKKSWTKVVNRCFRMNEEMFRVPTRYPLDYQSKAWAWACGIQWGCGDVWVDGAGLWDDWTGAKGGEVGWKGTGRGTDNGEAANWNLFMLEQYNSARQKRTQLPEQIKHCLKKNSKYAISQAMVQSHQSIILCCYPASTTWPWEAQESVAEDLWYLQQPHWGRSSFSRCLVPSKQR